VKLQGTAALPAGRQAVWDLLTDPEKLASLLPGCERLVPDGPDKYKVQVKFGIAAISGNYSGALELADQKPPQSMRIRMEGKGAPGFVNGEGRITLTEKNGRTELKYEGEAHVGGLIASVGQRMIEVTARKIIQQIFDSAAKQLQATSC
jgi:carbon monoxide dehydrogenase subunit G